jgi:hypothetical protein
MVAHSSRAAAQRSRIYACSHCSSLLRLLAHAAHRTPPPTALPQPPGHAPHQAAQAHTQAHRHTAQTLSLSKVHKIRFPHAGHSVFFNRLSYSASRRHTPAAWQSIRIAAHTRNSTTRCAAACAHKRETISFQGLQFASHGGAQQQSRSAAQSDICLFSLLITPPPPPHAQLISAPHPSRLSLTTSIGTVHQHRNGTSEVQVLLHVLTRTLAHSHSGGGRRSRGSITTSCTTSPSPHSHSHSHELHAHAQVSG